MSNSGLRDAVVVVGASGRTGRIVLRYLGATSIPTIACVRHADRLPAADRFASLEVAIADIEQPQSLVAPLERAAHVIYVAGSQRRSLAPGAWQLEVDCLASCLELARRSGLAGRWVCAGFSGEARGGTHWAEVRWRELKAAAEDVVAASGLDYVVLRTGQVTEAVRDEPRVFVSQKPGAAPCAELPCNVLAFLMTGAALSGATPRSRAVVGLDPGGLRLQPAVQALGRLRADAADRQPHGARLSRA